MAGVREQSLKSLLVAARANERELGTATAFVATYGDQPYLVTNWHVAAGRRPDNGEVISPTGAVPDDLSVMHHVAGKLGQWRGVIEPLYDANGEPLWWEHPTHGRQVDVVVLPLTNTTGVQLYPYDPSNPGPGVVYGPSEGLSIIGFPFGLTGGGALGIWVQGTVATEPELDFNDLPCLLIDSRTRSGQSGSPVIAYRPAGHQTEATPLVIGGGPAEQFVGVYSGRISDQSDLGFVWKVGALLEILDGQRRGTA